MFSKTLLAAAAACTLAAVPAAGMAATQVTERAQVPGRHGSVSHIELLKTGKHLETVTCRDFGMLDENFRPQAVVYAANYGPKGKMHPTMTLDGVENVVPVVVQQCHARPGDHFTTAVNRAMAMARRK